MGRIIELISILLLVTAALVLFTAGCVTDAHTDVPGDSGNLMTIPDNYNLIVGTWTSGDYSSRSGSHYTKVVDIYYDNNTIDEYLYHEDGSYIFWKGIWIYNSDGSYDAYYATFTFAVNNNEETAMVSCDYFDLKNLIFKHSDGKKGIIGEWVNAKDVQIPGGYNQFKVIINEDGSGKLLMDSDEDKITGTAAITWVGIGKNMYVMTVSDTVHLKIEKDGKLYDNLGRVYTREE